MKETGDNLMEASVEPEWIEEINTFRNEEREGFDYVALNHTWNWNAHIIHLTSVVDLNWLSVIGLDVNIYR